MQNKNIYFITTVLSIFIFSSCQDVIKVEIPQDQKNKLVVDGWMFNDSVACLNLSSTAPYFENGLPPRITDALVTISDGQTIDTLEHQGNGFYKNNQIVGVVGKTYTLTIKTKDGKEYNCVEKLPRGIELDTVFYKTFPGNGGQPQMFTFFAYQETPGVGDFYMARFSRNDTLFFSPQELNFTDDKFIDGSYIPEVFASFRPVKPGDKVTVEGISLTESSYRFLYQVQQNTAGQGNIFSPPAAPIRGNISNGALGMFMFSSRHAISQIVQ